MDFHILEFAIQYKCKCGAFNIHDPMVKAVVCNQCKHEYIFIMELKEKDETD